MINYKLRSLTNCNEYLLNTVYAFRLISDALRFRHFKDANYILISKTFLKNILKKIITD